MKLLALDTSSLACTVAVSRDGTVYEQHEEQERAHTRLLVPMIRAALDEAGLALAELDAIVLGNGPGSFIGMRIAASVTEGLAFGAGLPVVPVSSMAAVAADVGETGDIVCVAQDAHMQEVYLGLYERSAAGLARPLREECLQGQARIAELAHYAPGIAAGFGWQRYPELRELNADQFVFVSDQYYPRASALLRLGAAAFAAGQQISPAEIEPAYLRQTVAQKPAASVS